MVFSNLLYYFAVQSTFNMDKDKALASVNEIKELMEKSSKFVSFSGLAAIMAGIYSLAGSIIARADPARNNSHCTGRIRRFNRHRLCVIILQSEED